MGCAVAADDRQCATRANDFVCQLLRLRTANQLHDAICATTIACDQQCVPEGGLIRKCVGPEHGGNFQTILDRINREHTGRAHTKGGCDSKQTDGPATDDRVYAIDINTDHVRAKIAGTQVVTEQQCCFLVDTVRNFYERSRGQRYTYVFRLCPMQPHPIFSPAE